MLIEIKNRYTGKILLSGEYSDIKDCLEKNRGAYLRGANLTGAYLRGAHLEGANLTGAYLRGAHLEDANLTGAYLRGAHLEDAYFEGAHLEDANLTGAHLEDAYFRDANLTGAKGYFNSHEVFAEIVRRQPVLVFNETEWSAIAQIIIHRLCWDSIIKRFSNVMPHIFEILAKAGFTEWLEFWKDKVKKGGSDGRRN